MQTLGFSVCLCSLHTRSHAREESICNTDKERHTSRHVKNCKSTGAMYSMYTCGLILSVDELYRAESLSQVALVLCLLFNMLTWPVRLIYDNACQLFGFANNPIRKDKHPDLTKLSELSFHIDSFHLDNHQESCRTLFNIANASCSVNTQICEQTFRWLSGYKHMTRHMNEGSFLLYLLYVCHLHNSQVLLAIAAKRAKANNENKEPSRKKRKTE